jgi:hypothetical protein
MRVRTEIASHRMQWCEHGNELSAFIKYGAIIDHLSDCHIFNNTESAS